MEKHGQRAWHADISTDGATKHGEVSSPNIPEYSIIRQNLVAGIGEVWLLPVKRETAVCYITESAR